MIVIYSIHYNQTTKSDYFVCIFRYLLHLLQNTVEKMYASREDIGYDFGEDSKVGSKPTKPNPNIDGGWAWMIVLSSFLVHILIMGSQMALGILNMEWLEEFNQSRGLTAWVSSLSMGITLIVGMCQHRILKLYIF